MKASDLKESAIFGLVGLFFFFMGQEVYTTWDYGSLNIPETTGYVFFALGLMYPWYSKFSKTMKKYF